MVSGGIYPARYSDLMNFVTEGDLSRVESVYECGKGTEYYKNGRKSGNQGHNRFQVLLVRLIKLIE